jgi:hypothetical protein
MLGSEPIPNSQKVNRSTMSNAATEKPGAGPYSPLDGKAPKTREGYNVAESSYNLFAKLQGNGEKLLAKICKEDLTKDGGKKVIESFSKFASFLLKHKDAGGKILKPDVQLQYLGGAKNILAGRFKDIKMLRAKDEANEWFVELRVSFHQCAVTSSNVLVTFN